MPELQPSLTPPTSSCLPMEKDESPAGTRCVADARQWQRATPGAASVEGPPLYRPPPALLAARCSLLVSHRSLLVMKLALAACVALLAVVSLRAEDEMEPPVRQNETRISNVNPAWPGQFPYMAYVRSTDASGKLSTECSGTLINATAVLTAAWCVDGLTKHTVRLGSIHPAGEDENVWTVVSRWAMKHPKYNKSSADYDVAIIFLPELAPLHDEHIQLVDLPSSLADSSYVGCPAIVTGWARYSLGFSMSEGLHWAEVVVLPNEFCKKVLPNNKITDRQLCAAGSTPNAYGQSDGGAPLLLKTEGGYVQIGVYSRIPPDSFNPFKPAAYTRVSAVVDWIHSTICAGNDQQIPGGSEE